MKGQLARGAAISGDGINIPIAIATRSERDPFAVGRKERIRIGLKVLGQGSRASAAGSDSPNVTAIDKSETLAIGAKRGHTGADNRFLIRQRELCAQQRSCRERKGDQ